ncbi:MAG: methyltransferase [Magnetococcales bacterium]|nr:methyltransferase [Magnetococcales bacterium]
MATDQRALERFFQGVADQTPTPAWSHLHLVHWPGDCSPLVPLTAAGFQGTTLTVARASIVRVARERFPQLGVIPTDHPTAGQPADHVLMELPQGRTATRLTVTAALGQLSPTGALWLFGRRDGGILWAAKRFTGATTVLSRGHLRLLRLPRDSLFQERPGDPPPPAIPADGFLPLDVAGLTLATRPGLFSWDSPDPASLLLLAALEDTPPVPRLLDWGCGSGLLGVALARRWPGCRVTMTDDQFSAVACARQSAAWNGVDKRCQIWAEAGIGETLSKHTFDAIVTNPPFHRGVATDRHTTPTFLRAAAQRLAPGGSLWVVGNRFLDYGTRLAQVLTRVRQVADDGRFTVWQGHRQA